MSPETVSGSAYPTAGVGDSFCFRIKEQRQGWNVLLPVPARSAVDIYALVKQAPEFLGMDGAGPAVRVVVQLAGTEAAGAVALVALDEAGGLALVGCPLKNTRDAYTALVRELLGLHGRLWRMSFEGFAALADKALGRPLLKLMAEKTGPAFAEAEFKAGVGMSLERGRFPVIVLLNDADKEATDAVTYLKSLGLDLKLFGIDLFEGWGVEIVLPKLLAVGEPARDAGAQAKTVARPAPPPRPTPRVGGVSPASVASFGGGTSQPTAEPKSVQWPQAEPPRQAQSTRPAQAEPKPTPESGEKVWDGTKPGVMSGEAAAAQGTRVAQRQAVAMAFTPCVARFKRFGDRWFAFAGQAGTAPVDVLQLVIEAPEFLGMLTPGKPMPRAAMVAPGTQSNRVLVVVDEVGGVQLAVCPEPGGGLAAAVGELLAAGGKLWHQKYSALAGPFEEFLGMALADWVAARVGEGWSVDKFRNGLEQSLNEGKFPITVVVDQLDDATRESLEYLRNMNMQVRAIGYSSSVSGEDEVVRPSVLAGDRPAPAAQPVQPPPRQAQPPPRTAVQPRAEASFGTPQSGDPIRTFKDEFTPTAAPSPQVAPGRDYGPLPVSDATPKQKELLARLVHLDELGLPRRGFEYFLPGVQQKDTVEGTIVIAIDPDRWPFPKPDEVIIVVNTGPDHLAAYLKIAPREIEEFLGSLPRADRKEHKGALLLRAATVSEAAQLVNELKALKEVSLSG